MSVSFVRLNLQVTISQNQTKKSCSDIFLEKTIKDPQVNFPKLSLKTFIFLQLQVFVIASSNIVQRTTRATNTIIAAVLGGIDDKGVGINDVTYVNGKVTLKYNAQIFLKVKNFTITQFQ